MVLTYRAQYRVIPLPTVRYNLQPRIPAAEYDPAKAFKPFRPSSSTHGLVTRCLAVECPLLKGFGLH